MTRLDLLPLAARAGLGDGPALILVGAALKPEVLAEPALANLRALPVSASDRTSLYRCASGG